MNKQFLSDLFFRAVSAADPMKAIAGNLPRPPTGRTVVIGVGKAAIPMYLALRQCWIGPLSGVLVTGDSQGVLLGNMEIIESGHPVPDECGLHASRRLQELVCSLGPNDLILALISGGGSAMLPAPPDGLSLFDEIATSKALLASGAPISAMNTVRKHLSTIKGGRLAHLTKARVHSFVVSDIPGDAAYQVASGPTLPDKSTPSDALDIISHYGIVLLPKVLEYLKTPQAHSPSPDDIHFRNHTHVVVASSQLSLEASASLARENGITPYILSDSLEGEAREAGRFHAALTRQVCLQRQPFAGPLAMISGGETTVTLRGKGRGGRNGEFLLSWAIAVDGMQGIGALAADTDGIDGSECNAGAFADGTTVQRLKSLGMDARKMLAENDSFSAFSALGDLFVTGPTGTNVNDFRAIIIH